MTKEELKAHCEKQVKMCEEWAKGNGREPGGKIYEEHKLILDLIDELKDKSYELWKESYEEEHLRNIRLEEKIKTLEKSTSEDCISREAVLETIEDCNKSGLTGIFCSYNDGERFKEYIKNLPPVTSTHRICKDCSHYDPLTCNSGTCLNPNMQWSNEVSATHYCADFEKRGNENESIN